MNGQESHGPGTVVGHSKEVGWLKVKWDSDAHVIRWHRYGSTLSETDKYEVKVCDEPRILQNESIATGCLVVRGQDWEWGRQDGGPGNIGSVLKVDDNGVILVRWKNGNMHRYRFGYEGCFDLQICDPFSPESIQHLKDQMLKAALYYPAGDQSAVKEAVVDNALETSSETCDKSEELGEKKSCGYKSSPILNVSKGKYFKNDTRQNKTLSDTETDGCTVPVAMKQWLWQDKTGQWILFPKETNEKINMSYKRDQKSTVVAFIGDQAYRIVMAKNIQINLKTREIFKVKLVTKE
uniref:Uncharacterized protein LOC111131710 n=1 Tax=Crassostrea virginica TaxID=6565 RepID=A0A8B8E5X0_CRAVI|nr:uncharacterized protein LOC111131710 [Crassostrea virginica]